jgi:hypothetical protein
VKDGLTARARANLVTALLWDVRKLKTWMLAPYTISDTEIYVVARRVATRVFRLHPELRG